MALVHLPNELLHNIVIHTLPEGFEALALSCKRIYAICLPLIEHHNTLSRNFQSFSYVGSSKRPESVREALDRPYAATLAYNLIAHIAVEPVVAQYIQRAKLKYDSRCTWLDVSQGQEEIADPRRDEAVAQLLADSSYLKEAGLDWKEYYAAIQQDLDNRKYSQHAAAFLLTLLPNVRKVTLPIRWESVDAPDRLIDVVIRRAREAPLRYDTPSMTQVSDVIQRGRRRLDLDRAAAFMALPHVRSFCGLQCIDRDDDPKNIAPKYLRHCSFDALQSVELRCSLLDGAAVEALLKCAPHIKIFQYTASPRYLFEPRQSWDICAFVTGIAYGAGANLKAVSVCIDMLLDRLVPGKACLRGFQRLQTLEIPLEMVKCHLDGITTSAAAPTGVDLDEDEHRCSDPCITILGDFVPPSVLELSLLSRKSYNDDHALALSALFGDLAANKESLVPALKIIHLACPLDASKAYKKQCANLIVEAEKAGVVLRLTDKRPISSHLRLTESGGLGFTSGV